MPTADFAISRPTRHPAHPGFSAIAVPWTRQLEFHCAVAVAFLAPMNFVRLPGVYVTASDIFCWAVCALVVINRTLPAPRLGAASATWCTGVIALTAFLFLSSTVNGDPMRGAIVSVQYIQAYLVLPLVFVTRSRDELVTMTKAFLLSIAAMSLFGAWLIHFDGATNTRFVTGNGRMRSFVERTNEAAALIALATPLLILMWQWKRWSLPVIGILMLISAYGILLTGSNTGVMSFALAVGLVVTLSRSWRLLGGGILAAGTAIFVVIRFGEAFLPPVFVERVLGALVSGDLSHAGTYSDRVDLINSSLFRANETLFLGVGADQFPVGTLLRQTVHNAYLLLWVEGGPGSATGLVLIVLGGVVLALQALVHNAPVRFAARPTKDLGLFGYIRRPFVGSSRLAGSCALSTVLLFALVVNAVPHVYGRFWVVPVLLALGLASTTLAGDGSTDRSMAAPRR